MDARRDQPDLDAAELEAKKQAAPRHNGPKRSQLRKRKKHDGARVKRRPNVSALAVLAIAVVTLILGLLIGMGLGLRTREDHQSQQGRPGGVSPMGDRHEKES